MQEIWKPIAGTGGRIEVSNCGRVRSLLRDGRILRQQRDQKGYLRVTVTIDRQKRTYKVHRTVAAAFIDNPRDLPQVNHIDGNKENNAIDNLEWCSNAQNAQHAMDNGLWDNVYAASMRANKARMRPVVATHVCSGLVTCFPSMRDAEKACNTKHINAVITGERRQANGYTFSYAEEVI